jgi:hypothetical protein
LFLAWLAAALILSWAGFYEAGAFRLPTLQYGLLIPIAAGVVLFRRWATLRNTIRSIPQSWLVGIQTYRALGLTFLILYAEKLLPGAFALPAGIGDVIVGVLAPLVAVASLRDARGSSKWLRAWNLLGLTDLVVAVSTGFLTSPSPLQLLAFDRPNLLVASFPMVMIPVFLVPLAVLLHLASLERLRSGSAQSRWSASEAVPASDNVRIPRTT